MQPTLMEPIYCRQCGHILQPGQHYCPSCGTAIRMIASQPSLPAPAPVQSSTPSPRTRKLPSAGILIAIAIALFVLASFLYTTVKMVVAFDPAIVLSARGTCQIKVSRVEHFYNPWVQADSSNVQARLARNEEKAQVTYTLLTTDGRAFQGSSYDWMDDVRVDEGWDQAQAIVNQYGVGHSYPCWYNPLLPSVSALRQSVDWSVDLSFNHATLLFNVGGFVWVLMLLVGLPVATMMTVTRSWSWHQRR